MNGVLFGSPAGRQSRSHTCSVGASSFVPSFFISQCFTHSYWVLAVGWFLLYCFINDHSLETCQRIYKVQVALIRFSIQTDRFWSCRSRWHSGISWAQKVGLLMESALWYWHQFDSYPAHPHLRVFQPQQICSFLSYRLFNGSCSLPALCRVQSNVV